MQGESEPTPPELAAEAELVAEAASEPPADGELLAEAASEPPADQPTADGELLAAEVDPETAEPEVEADPEVEAEPDYKDQWMRAVAELDNVRKRARRDGAQSEQRGIARMARELLPALDNLDRAIAAAAAHPESANPELISGIRLVQEELLGALGRVGVVRDAALGEPFNPHLHEAVAQQPFEGQAAGTVIEVYEQGYRLGDEVLRAAKVVVAA